MDNEITSFNELCEYKAIWIIQYHSENYKKPLFLIWYTDTDKNSTDKLLSYKNDGIFVCNSLKEIQSSFLNEKNELILSKNLETWFSRLTDFDQIETHSYRMDIAIETIEKNNLNNSTIEILVNYINLFNDYVSQNSTNKNLKLYSGSLIIEKIWNYYYDNIFWAKKEKEKPKLEVNKLELLSEIKRLMELFENDFKIVCN